ncbi:hypothetical protein [Corallococcus aberystwythensis]|uniref:hypothetical protein n=1 Tax=Corallococcus aberystwythensis TaxID=2316722 RepID=UPI0011C4A92B|nr:hypothetical protein [Corallococcus aberystwythensis]
MLPDRYRKLEALPRPGRTAMDALVERQRQRFHGDLRTVDRWELHMTVDGEFSLMAEARGQSR